MLAVLTREVEFIGECFPKGTPGDVVRRPSGVILFRLRQRPRTIQVEEGDVEPVQGGAPLPPRLYLLDRATTVRHMAVGDVVRLKEQPRRPDRLGAPECPCGCGQPYAGDREMDRLRLRARRGVDVKDLPYFEMLAVVSARNYLLKHDTTAPHMAVGDVVKLDRRPNYNIHLDRLDEVYPPPQPVYSPFEEAEIRKEPDWVQDAIDNYDADFPAPEGASWFLAATCIILLGLVVWSIVQ